MTTAPLPALEPRVAIVDDHAMIREGFRNLASHGIKAGALAETVDELLRLEADPRNRSSIAVLDVLLSDRSWVGDNVRRLRQVGYIVVILTNDALPDALREALNAGASALVGKGDPMESLVAAIKAVHSGAQIYISTLMAQTIFSSLSLSHTDSEVLRHAAGGLTREEIAALLNTTTDAVEARFRAIGSAYRAAYPVSQDQRNTGGTKTP